MNKVDLIKKALNAVTYQQTEARNQLRNATDLQLEHLVQFWTVKVEEHEATYQGLLTWLLELRETGRQS